MKKIQYKKICEEVGECFYENLFEQADDITLNRIHDKIVNIMYTYGFSEEGFPPMTGINYKFEYNEKDSSLLFKMMKRGGKWCSVKLEGSTLHHNDLL